MMGRRERRGGGASIEGSGRKLENLYTRCVQGSQTQCVNRVRERQRTEVDEDGGVDGIRRLPLADCNNIKKQLAPTLLYSRPWWCGLSTPSVEKQRHRE